MGFFQQNPDVSTDFPLATAYSLTGKHILFLTVRIKTRNTRYRNRMNFLIKDEKKEDLYTLVANFFRILKHSPYLFPVWLHNQ